MGQNKKIYVLDRDLPNGTGADERRAESNTTEASEFATETGRWRRLAAHGVILLLALGKRQNNLFLFEIGAMRAEPSTT